MSSYDDWGAQQFETTGWSAPENFTGETTDPTQGLNHYYARAYDPSAAAWTSQDPWRGTTDEPRSQHRYGYGWNNPTSNRDVDGNLCARVNPKSDALPVGCGATPVQARDNVVDRSKPPVAPQPPREHPKADKPKAEGPNSQNNIQDRHTWEVVADILGIVGSIAGLAALIPSPIQSVLGAVAGIASSASTVISCLLGGSQLSGCIIGIVLALIPGIGAAAKVAVKGWVKDAVKGIVDALGASGNALGLAMSGGDLYVKARP
ncbi:RHS repeat-associated core domain-containing protein [Leifsonia sp. NPDC014704]|uniref:RHS repeat-associated core domain-containing protein n=1 Tax=Leifsonia sp. NPDC014704 TaxID=3364123 RepID=UPI0036F4ABFA